MNIEITALLSVFFLVTAILLTFRLVKIAGNRVVWMALLSALVILAAYQGYAIYGNILGTGNIQFPPLISDGILAVSILLLFVVASLQPLFKSMLHSEQALRESEGKFRALSETTETAIFVYRDRFLYLNPAAYKITGYSQEEILSMPFWKIAAPEFRELIKNRASRRLEGFDEPTRYELKILTSEGQEKWLDLTVGVIQFEGEQAGLATAFDITERKLAEEKTIASQKDLTAILENLEDISYRVDTEGRIIRVSPSVEHTLGYRPEELIGTQISRLYVEPDGREKFLHHLKLGNGKVKNYEAPLWKKDGGICWVSTHSHYYYNEYDEYAGIEGLTRDISERKIAEEALRQSEERFSKAFHSSPAMALISSMATGKIYDVSESFLKASGYQRNELVGKTVLDVGLWNEPGRRDEILKTLVEYGSVHEYEMTLRTKPGDIRFCLISMEIITIDNEKCIVTGGIDITDRKREDIDRRAREQRMRSQQVALLSLAKHESIHQGNLSKVIESITETSALTLNAGRSSVWLYDEERSKIICIDKYNQITGCHSQGDELIKNIYPEYFDAIEHNLVISADDARNDPRTQEFSSQYLPENNISSLLDAPIRLDGQTIGVLCHEHVGDIRHWSLDEQNFAASLAEMVALALDQHQRKEAESALFSEKERAHVTLESIGDGVVTTNIDGVIEYCNPIAEQLSGWSKESMVGQPLLKVFNIIDESSGHSVRDPVTRCLRENSRITLPQNSLIIHQNGKNRFFVEVSVTPMNDPGGKVIGVTLVFHDTTELRSMSRMMTYQATHDELTRLTNRREFEIRLKKAIESAHNDNKIHTMCYLDLDQFKIVNDTCGHSAGDELLKQFSMQLQDKIRESDTLARLGGDEFGILLNDCPIDKAHTIAESLRKVAKDFHFLWEGKVFEIGVSIGLAEITSQSGNIADVLKSADSACYVAKDNGRNHIHIYQADDSALLRRRGEMRWMQDIQRAFKENRFELYMQPIISLESGNNREQEMHCELLLRLNDDKGNIILPSIFLPAAEKYHLMPDIDRWVIKSAFSALYDNTPPLNNASLCAINISGQSLGNESFHSYTIDLFSHYKIDPQRICFEITETSVISNLSYANKFIKIMKEMGCSFALDDFGSGLSSFAYLKNLSVDYLKIDGGFVKDMLGNKNDHSMVKAINQIGKLMDIKTIAECVEDEKTKSALALLGVDFAQGSAISKPQPLIKGKVTFSELIESLSDE